MEAQTQVRSAVGCVRGLAKWINCAIIAAQPLKTAGDDLVAPIGDPPPSLFDGEKPSHGSKAPEASSGVQVEGASVATKGANRPKFVEVFELLEPTMHTRSANGQWAYPVTVQPCASPQQ